MTDLRSPFEKYQAKAWPHRFAVTVHIDVIAGGVPSDPKVAEGWLKAKLGSRDDQLRALVAEVMVERGVDKDAAAKIIDELKHLNGFRRNAAGELVIKGYMIKAALKEAASIAAAAGKLELRGWGLTKKFLLGFVAEHVQVVEDVISLGVTEPTGIMQSFPENKRIGMRGIQYVEYVQDREIAFTVASDWDFSDEEWAMIWLTGQMQGIGASRSQGNGRYDVTRWERLTAPPARKSAKKDRVPEHGAAKDS